MSLSLTDIRNRARLVSRNAMDPNNYNNAQIDAAISDLFSQFLRKTRCVKKSVTIQFVATTNTADFSDLSGFLATRIERARIDIDSNYTDVRGDLDRPGADEVLDALKCNTTTGTPRAIGFVDSVTAKLYPTPTADGSMTVIYAPLQTAFALGTRGPFSSGTVYYQSDVTSDSGNIYQALKTNTSVSLATTSTWLNLGAGSLVGPDNIVTVIPDGLVIELISKGAAAFLQSTDPKQKQAVAGKMAEYLAFEAACAAINSISGNAMHRDAVDDCRRGDWL